MSDETPMKKAVKATKQITQDQSELITKLEMQIVDLTEGLQRERADATNVRRRADEERIKMAGFYKAMVMKDLLPALDNLERALKHTPTEKDDPKKILEWVKGVESITKQFGTGFARLGIERIKTVGEVFNPAYHEAISMEDGDGNVEMVIEELQAGYRVGDEVIRHAMVKVRH